MKNIVLLILFLGNVAAFGQQTGIQEHGVSLEDSLKLDKVWHSLIAAVLHHDKKAIQAQSLTKLDCITCWMNTHKIPKDYIISIQDFTDHCVDSVFHKKVLSIIQTEPYRLFKRMFEDYSPKHIQLNKGEAFVIYELYIQTWKPGEYAPGHEGGTDVFQFMKVKGEFKFYGHTTIP